MRERMPDVVDAMATAVARETRLGDRSTALADLYENLASIDFSRAVLQGAEARLRVIAAPACGWSDLGTPRRVLDTLRRLEEHQIDRVASPPRLRSFITTPAFINLAAQRARLGFAG
jgi:hypothetical protein